MASEFSLNARCIDVLRHEQSYYFVYEKEQLERDRRVYNEVSKYIFYESGSDLVKIVVELEGIGHLPSH